MEHQDELDRWLDDALAAYKAPPPRPGLELRTLAHVHSVTERRRGRKWLLAPVAVAVLGAMAMLLRTDTPAPPPTVARVPQPATTPTVASPPPLAVMRHRPKPIAPATVVAVANPKLAVFPAPLPLTAEERAWVGLARRTSEALTQLAREQAMEPIVIPEIKIQTLEPKEENSGG